MTLLVCDQLHKSFGGLIAVNKVDLNVEKGEMTGLIGPNGAGKTTIFNLITGFLRPTSGKIWYEGNEISNLSPHVIASRGLVRTFQKISVFSDLSVLDNVIIGRHLQIKSGFFKSLAQSRKKRLEEKTSHDEALRILKTVGLSGWEQQQSKNLPIGLQRVLGIAVAMASNPKLLFLDESSSGMNVKEKEHIMEVIREIHQSGITILLVEHDMNVVMNLCQRIVVLDSGSIVAEGSPEEIQNNTKVIESYLGKGFTHATGCN